MHALSHYGLSPERGFLSLFEIDDVALPTALAPLAETAAMLPDYLASGRVRHWLARLPLLPVTALIPAMDDSARSVAMLRYGFLVQAWVWGETTPAHHLPEALAVPFVALAEALGLQPIMTYQHYVLDNWKRLDKAGPIALGNLAIDQHFAGGRDESGFILVHVAIEAMAGAALAACVALHQAAGREDESALEEALAALHAALGRLIAGLEPMAAACDPHVYFHRVRPYLFGWPGEGLVYEGVAAFAGRRVSLRGQTGSQSSIIPAIDAALAVPHGASGLSAFLAEIHAYRPPAHRAFIEALRTSHARAVAARRPAMRDAYNGCLEALARFRDAHLGLAARYIALPAAAAGKDGATGTGGTPFLAYLAQHRDDSRAAFL